MAWIGIEEVLSVSSFPRAGTDIPDQPGSGGPLSTS